MIYTDEFNSNRTGTGRNKTTRSLGDTSGKYTRVHWKKTDIFSKDCIVQCDCFKFIFVENDTVHDDIFNSKLKTDNNIQVFSSND